MSNPNLDSRYAKPADVAAAISAQAVTDAGQYLKVFKPETYGAKGDGTTDDTAAINACFSAAASAKGRVQLAAVTYKVSAALMYSSDLVEIEGYGTGVTIIAATGTAYDILTLGSGNGNQVRPTGFIRNLTVRGASLAPSSGKACVKINGLTQFKVEDIQVDNQDIGLDFVNNCYGSYVSNIRTGFAGTVNVGVNLRTGTQSGSDITFMNPWVAGRIAGFHCSGGGGGWHIFGGQIAGGSGTNTVSDTSGAVILGKDYLTSTTGECTIDIHGTSFEGTNYAWIIRSFDQIHLVIVGSSFNPADNTKPAIGVWKADALKNGRAEFYSSTVSGTFSGANLLVAQNNYYVSNYLIEQGTYTGANQPVINGSSTYVTSMAKQSGLIGNSITMGLNSMSVAGTYIRGNAGVLQQSTDESTWTNVATPLGLAGTFYHTGNQSITQNSNIQVTIGSTDFNDDPTNGYTLASNAITVKRSGLYLISFYADALGDGTAGSRGIYVQVNGTTTIAEAGTYTGGSEVRLSASKMVRLTANQSLTLNAYFTTTATIAGNIAKDTGLSVAYLGL